jgi:hypothetical protein
MTELQLKTSTADTNLMDADDSQTALRYHWLKEIKQ